MLTSSSSSTSPKTEGEYEGQQLKINSQLTSANAQSTESRAEKPVVVAAPIVVQMPKVVSVSLNATSVSDESQSFTSKENGVVETVDSSVSISQELKKSDFTNDDLIRVWRLYAKKIDGELHTSNTMQNFLPVKGEGALVIVKLINTMQLEALSRHRRTLEQFLSKELNNSDIVVNFEIEEQAAQSMLLTSDEKFKHMQEVNPDFRRLKGELGLEIV